MSGPNGEAWALLHELVLRLGLNGQSEDESDEESDVYTPVELYWRNPLVQRLLDFVDKCREQYARTPSGKRLPGNQFRTRERSVNPSVSQDSPPSGLPINLYMDTWYTGAWRRLSSSTVAHGQSGATQITSDQQYHQEILICFSIDVAQFEWVLYPLSCVTQIVYP